MGVLKTRRADAIGTDESGDAREGFGEAVGIAKTGVEQALLTNEGTGGREAKFDGVD